MNSVLLENLFSSTVHLGRKANVPVFLSRDVSLFLSSSRYVHIQYLASLYLSLDMPPLLPAVLKRYHHSPPVVLIPQALLRDGNSEEEVESALHVAPSNLTNDACGYSK